MAAAASLLPPPSPAATGMRLVSRAASGGAPEPPRGRSPRTAARVAAIARRTRLSGVGGDGQARRLAALSAWPRPARSRRSSASPSVERHHDRVKGVEAVVAPAEDGERQVQLGRRKPDDVDGNRPGRPTGSDPASRALQTSRWPRHGVALPGSGPSAASQRQPLVHGERLRSPVAVDPDGRQRLRRRARAGQRQLPRQDVVELLAALAEAGLDEPPEIVLVRRRRGAASCPAGSQRADLDDGRLDLGRRLERLSRHRRTRSGRPRGTGRRPRGSSCRRARPRSARATSRWSIRTSRSGRGGSPEEAVQDRAGDVVRDVGHDLERRLDQTRDLLVEDVALDEREGTARRWPRPGRGPAGRPAGGPAPRPSRQRPPSSSPPVRIPSPGPTSRMRRPGCGRGQVEDRLQHVRIGQEVLRQRVAGSQTLVAEQPPNGQRIQPRSLAGRPARGVGAPGVALRVGRLAHRRASGSDGRASRSSPARAPASQRRAAAAPIIAPLSVHSAGRGTTSGIPAARAAFGQAIAQDAVGGHSAAEHDGPRPACRAARSVLVTSTSTTDSWKPSASSATRSAGSGVVAGRDAPRRPALDGDRPPRRGLEAAEAEVERCRPARPAGRPRRGASPRPRPS